MARSLARLMWLWIASVILSWSTGVGAAVHDLAADFSLTNNPSGVWTYGYMSAGQFNHTYDEFLTTSSSDGFVAYDMTGPAGGGGGTGWTTSFGFPFAGVWAVPPTAASVATYPGLTDFPSAEGDNPNYPNGILGGHGPNTPFTSGWYAVKYTAPSNETIDLDIDAWQTAIYPNQGAGNPAYGGATRPQQTLIQKQVGSTYTNLLRAPLVTRHGITNESGMPEHTFNDSPTPGFGEGYATQEDEIDAAMRNSENPNDYRLTGIQLNAGESVIISFAPYQGDNHVGFVGLNAIVRSGADRVATNSWNLSDDWSVVGASAAGIGPDAAWSYGILQGGSFTAYDDIRFGITAEDEGTVERENNGWGEPLGWFLSSAIPAEGPIVPGIVKSVDGINALTGGFDAGSFTQPPTGDFTGGKVVLHTPPPDVDADQTSVVRWTAPRSMSVDASGALWRATLADETDRRHQFDLLHNGSSIASGTVDELGFDCGAGETNSACPVKFNVSNINVAAGDTLELHIAPLEGGGSPLGDYNGNGIVDAGDYTAWRDNLGSSMSLPNDDSPGVGQDDFDRWIANFGDTGGGGGESASPSFVGVDLMISEAASAGIGSGAVPEPGALALVILATMLAAIARRRVPGRSA